MEINLVRRFVKDDLQINSFNDIEACFTDLQNRILDNSKAVWQWLIDRSELKSVLSEELAWRYIKMNANTADTHLAQRFNQFVAEIEPKISVASNELNKKLNNDSVLRFIDAAKLFVMIRELKKDIDIFRESNVPLEAELQQLEQDYGVMASKMTVHIQDQELTLQQASNYLKELDRNLRHEVYLKINDRRLHDSASLNQLLSELIQLRHQIALNADFNNYRDYKFREAGRFDYTVEDCFRFHRTVSRVVTPVINQIMERRKQNLHLEQLRPWDLDVDEEGLSPLKPFDQVDDLIHKAIWVFRDLEPEFGIYLNEMNKKGRLDLESRKDKAPGGFNYPLHESNIPFIFMNASGNFHDMITMLHEGGHAVHAFLSAPLELVDFKETPPEIAELASMSMELITMDYWHHFFPNPDELKRAKRLHLEEVLTVLPWVATIDKFQHFLYENPNHKQKEREDTWLTILNEMGNQVVDYSGLEKYKANLWQKQLHIFEIPFYYIEYGFAQLGAIAIWRNFRQNKEQALKDFMAALKLGYSVPIPDVYRTAGIQFNFSEPYISELMEFVNKELEHLY